MIAGQYVVPPTTPDSLLVSAGGAMAYVHCYKGCKNSDGSPHPDEIEFREQSSVGQVPISSVEYTPDGGAKVTGSGSLFGHPVTLVVTVSAPDAIHMGQASFTINGTAYSSGPITAGQVYINPA